MLHERTYCCNYAELERDHAKLLQTYRHVRASPVVASVLGVEVWKCIDRTFAVLPVVSAQG